MVQVLLLKLKGVLKVEVLLLLLLLLLMLLLLLLLPIQHLLPALLQVT